MRIPTIVELNNAFILLSQSFYEGVAGVICIDSGQPGPILGITACTHGNEPCGIAAIQSLLDMFDSGQRIKRGKLYLIVNNLDAARRYFAAVTDDEKRLARLININLNRLPENVMELAEDSRYEIKRAQELKPIWIQFDYGLDIHSTTQDMGSMLISTSFDLPLSLIHGFPIEKIISNINNIQIGYSAACFYGKPEAKAKTYGVECGAHEAPLTFTRAITSVYALLRNLNMIEGEMPAVCDKYEEYFINKPIIFPDTSYELVRLFKNFEFIAKETVLARGNGPDILASADCHTIFASKTKPDFLEEEVMFLSEPVRLLKIT